MPRIPVGVLFSAALCRGLIEARAGSRAVARAVARFSAALCRGLIEATMAGPCGTECRVFSAALCRGLIEAWGSSFGRNGGASVFRGFMPRPH